MNISELIVTDEMQMPSSISFDSITTSGNVGIGTSSPGSKLHVAGDISLDAYNLGEGHGIFFRNGTSSSVGDGTYNMSITSRAFGSTATPDGILISGVDGIGFATGISNTYDSNYLRMVILSNGKVGIGMTSPTSKLTINSGSTSNQDNEMSYHGLAITTGTNFQTMWLGYDGSADVGYINCAKSGSARHLCLQTRGYCVGIGTTSPHAQLHVAGQGINNGALSNSSRSYFKAGTGVTATSGIGEHGAYMSIYAWSRIVTSDYFIAHGSSSFSDTRIKNNIIDINDSSALDTIRLIKPKKYSYLDTFKKGTELVWGFIAQEVSDVLDYAVDFMEKAIPNVYKLASVSEDNTILTFEEPVSLEVGKIQLKTLITEEHDVEVTELISTTSVRLSVPLSEEHHTGKMGDENVVRKVFVYGQWVDDFHVLKKDAIFTVAVAALQEVDRRQVADKKRITKLEAENEALQSEVNLLKQQMATVMQKLGL